MNEELERLDELYGLEVRLSERIPLDSSGPRIIESFRRMDDFYNEFCMARFNLIMGKKESYPEYNVQSSVPDSNKWIQYSFLNTSIMWYDNCFDILLQIIWIYFEMYIDYPEKINPNPIDWNKIEFEKLLIGCRYEKFEKWGMKNENKERYIIIKTLYASSIVSKVRHWANRIKHRSPIHIKGATSQSSVALIYADKISITEKTIKCENTGNSYDSNESCIWYDTNYIIDTLIHVHTSFVDAIKKLIFPIIAEFEANDIQPPFRINSNGAVMRLIKQ